MGRYDFGSICSASIIENGNDYVKIRVNSYWKNNGWTYHMQPVYGYTYCNGSEVCVYNAGYPDFTSDQNGQYLLGSHDYTITKNHGNQNINCRARCRSESSYATGDKWSSIKSINVGARTSYKVTYNANGGSGAPGSQTKWYNENLTLSSTKPTRTGYTFTGWSGGYRPGQVYSGNANLNLTAQWKANTYTVSYNANGGSGAPSSQTKTYGVTLKLSSTKPTRTNYNFKGWSTSKSGSVSYSPGGNYTNNSSVTLYAVWELAYVKPRIKNFNAQRCTSNGTASENGTYIKATFSWQTDKTVSNVYVQWHIQNSSTWSSYKVSASGTSGSVSQIVGSGGINIESTYIIRCYVQDSGGTTYSSEVSIGTISYPIDVRKGGKGVAFGKTAEEDDVFDVGFAAKFRNGITGDLHGIADEVKIGARNTTDTWIPVFKDNTLQYTKRFIPHSKTHSQYNTEQDRLATLAMLSYWDGSYNSGHTSNLTYCSGGSIQPKPVSLYNNSSGASGTVNLSQDISNFSYIEIFYGKSYNFSNSIKVRTSNCGSIGLMYGYIETNAQLGFREVRASGTTITNNNSRYGGANLYNSKTLDIYKTNEIVIFSVIGYK